MEKKSFNFREVILMLNRDQSEIFHQIEKNSDEYKKKIICDIIRGIAKRVDKIAYKGDLDEFYEDEGFIKSLIEKRYNILIDWISRIENSLYIDRAIEDFGYPEEGFPVLLRLGYREEVEELLPIVIEYIQDHSVDPDD